MTKVDVEDRVRRRTRRRVWVIAMLIEALCWSAAGSSLVVAQGCADPGGRALERVERGAEALIRIAQRRSVGELDEVATNAALAAWERTHGVVITETSAEAARALGSEAREVLAERWREAAERLERRLSGVVAEKAAPR
jgi:hypothetical protein